ncbi:MAG: AMP-binding protein [Kiritimatiellae bacterium]|nr:AMP-binding protein [Kiritimatiellia bacterium]
MEKVFKLTDPYGSAPARPPFTQSVSTAEPWGRASAVEDVTLGELLDRTVKAYPQQDAMVFPETGYRRTWLQLGGDVELLARALMAIGIQKGEKIALLSTNEPDWVVMMFAAAKIGAVLLPLNINFREYEFEQALTQSEAETVFVMERYRDTDFLAIAAKYIPELATSPKGQLKSKLFPKLRRIVSLGTHARRGMYTIAEVRRHAAATTWAEYGRRQSECKPTDVVNMQYTSGTTGFPKGAMLTHRNIINDSHWIGACMSITHADRMCIPVPLFHCFGCVLGIVVATVFGAAMVMLRKFDPVEVMSAIEKERCTSLYGVPTMYISILDHPLFPKFDFSSIRTGVMSGAPCPLVRMEQTIEKMGMKEICVPYGLTEAGPVMTMTRGWEKSVQKRCDTVGLALPGIEVAVIDPATGDLAPLGAVGELCCRGYNTMQGYYAMPDDTAATIDENGFLHSGDLGRMDADGYFYFTGRLKDIIIRGGENISAAEVEQFLAGMPEIADVKVVGVPSKKYGEQPGAFIILREGCEIAEAEVADFCRNRIAWFKIPKYIKFVKEFPLTASGKVQKYRLRELAHSLWPDA